MDISTYSSNIFKSIPSSVLLEPLVRPILEKEEAIAIARIKANSITRTEELMVFEHAFHCDFAPTMGDLTTAIYYINTCDGYTLFEDGTKVECVQ